MMTEKLMLIDANSLLYRAFFALPPLVNSKGQPTGAVYGLVNMLLKLLEQYTVDYAVAAFDLPGPTRRSEEYSEYKANRPPTPFELRSQVQIAREVLEALGIQCIDGEGYEADDLVGSMAARATEAGYFSWIVSGDRDILQVAGERTSVIMTHKGISQTTVYDPGAVVEKYGVAPAQIVDIKGLAGDVSDNIPGVPGIGEKTASKLIAQYGSVAGVYENLDQLKGKLRENLERYRDQAFLSRSLAEIDTWAPLPGAWPPNRLKRDNKSLYRLLKGLEFNSLLERLALVNYWDVQVEGTSASEVDEEIFSPARLAVLLNGETLAVGGEGRAWLFSGDAFAVAAQRLEEFLSRETTLVTDDAKKIYRFVFDREIQLKARVHSCQLAAYLLKPGSDMGIPALVRSWLEKAVDPDQWRGAEYGAAYASLLPELWKSLDAGLAESQAWDLYEKIELPLSRVLARMERTGIAVDIRELEPIGAELEAKIATLDAQIQLLAGWEFNVNSPKQLGEVLFERLGIPPVRKTKTGYSTDAAVLEAISERHEIVPLILEYRQLVKLQSTYIQGLKDVWDEETGRVYTNFNQMVTATGRLSSTEPNLQNIPVRLEEGRRIRRAFVPGGGYQRLLAADYSQIELRILAHISGDAALLEAFHRGEDIHRRTAAEIFGVGLDEVSESQRRGAKAVNFGLVYGQTDFGLASSLGIGRQEAADYISAYFRRYPGVKQYMENTVARAKKDGFVTTLFNRRRYLPEIGSRNFQRRSFAERTAINTPIQGTAADIIKLAMVEVERRLEGEGLVSRMLLQVHDELVLETTTEELKRVAKLVTAAMEEIVPLDVPLVVEVKTGTNWYNLAGIKDQ